MGPGFYKYDNGNFLYGPVEVVNTSYDLLATNYTEYTYPVDGWYWFDSETDARTALNCPAPIDESAPSNN